MPLLLHCIVWDFSKQVSWSQIWWCCYSHLCACKPVLMTANGFKPASAEESDSQCCTLGDLSIPALDSAMHTWCGSSVSNCNFLFTCGQSSHHWSTWPGVPWNFCTLSSSNKECSESIYFCISTAKGWCLEANSCHRLIQWLKWETWYKSKIWGV